MTAWPIGRSGNIGKKGAKYLVILTEGGVPPVEQRMSHTRVADSTTPPVNLSIIAARQPVDLAVPVGTQIREDAANVDWRRLRGVRRRIGRAPSDGIFGRSADDGLTVRMSKIDRSMFRRTAWDRHCDYRDRSCDRASSSAMLSHHLLDRLRRERLAAGWAEWRPSAAPPPLRDIPLAPPAIRQQTLVSGRGPGVPSDHRRRVPGDFVRGPVLRAALSD